MNMLLINALLQKINFALSNYDDYEIKNIYHDCITNSLFVVVFYEQEIEEIVRDLDKKKRELTSYIIMKASSQSSDTLELYENLILGHELSIK